jgi:hypothetical protein
MAQVPWHNQALMANLRSLLNLFKRKPKTPEQVQREAEAIEAQRNFELSKARYRPR